ncbi:MAG TPA: hypothetical protein VE986_09215 [Hyphomicrobiales bacterium]|nr:hypothetical protein [Hyphomicrobiales bacterium]
MIVRYSSEYWQARAKEARAIAEEMTFPHTKQMMIRAAEGYEWLAKLAGEEWRPPAPNAPEEAFLAANLSLRDKL